MDEGTKNTVSKLPLLSVRASPRDNDAWTARLKQELTALIQYVKLNKEEDKDWFHIECNKTGTRWNGTCWYYYEQIRYEFDLEFEIPVTYPNSAPELKLPQLEGLTSKMYRGGKICQTVHFQPLWAKNVPRFGIAHSLALSVSCSFRSVFLDYYPQITALVRLIMSLNQYLLTNDLRTCSKMQLGPWLAAEIPDLVGRGVIDKFKK